MNSRYVGATEEKWREIFKQLVETQPSILIIDEADSVFATRSDAENAQHYNRTVTQLLTLIEDLEKQDDKVAIIATTNRLDSIDPAIKRSGRFGDVLEIKKPDKNACLEILNLYLEGKNIDESFDKESYVDMLHQGGLTGADIAFIVNSVRDRAYERLGFFEQMENGEFEKESLEGLKYTQEDFLLAYADWAKNHKTEKKLFKFLG
ncbi:MAG: AAA family ATPase [Deferribacterales bacterium]|nr:AAA family ATPase [Deferribacterales bacterium]